MPCVLLRLWGKQFYWLPFFIFNISVYNICYKLPSYVIHVIRPFFHYIIVNILRNHSYRLPIHYNRITIVISGFIFRYKVLSFSALFINIKYLPRGRRYFHPFFCVPAFIIIYFYISYFWLYI